VVFPHLPPAYSPPASTQSGDSLCVAEQNDDLHIGHYPIPDGAASGALGYGVAQLTAPRSGTGTRCVERGPRIGGLTGGADCSDPEGIVGADEIVVPVIRGRWWPTAVVGRTRELACQAGGAGESPRGPEPAERPAHDVVLRGDPRRGILRRPGQARGAGR